MRPSERDSDGASKIVTTGTSELERSDSGAKNVDMKATSSWASIVKGTGRTEANSAQTTVLTAVRENRYDSRSHSHETILK
jgi:hypothetical protein